MSQSRDGVRVSFGGKMTTPLRSPSEVPMRSSCTLLLGFSAALLVCPLGPTSGRPPAADPEPARTVKELQKERVDVITERVAQARKAAKAGAALANEVQFWEERLAVATAELEGKVDDLRKLYERRLAALREGEKAAERTLKAGAGSRGEVLEWRDARLEAEIALVRLGK